MQLDSINSIGTHAGNSMMFIKVIKSDADAAAAAAAEEVWMLEPAKTADTVLQQLDTVGVVATCDTDLSFHSHKR